MATWFECKFKFNREDEQGGFKSISETFLIDAVSFTEAETRVYSEVASNLRDFLLLKVGKYTLHDLVFNENAQTWYKCKVAMVTVDEKSGKEKKVKQTILVCANNVKEAYDSVEDLFSTALSNFEILDIVTTQIVEILPYFDQTEEMANQEVPTRSNTLDPPTAAPSAKFVADDEFIKDEFASADEEVEVVAPVSNEVEEK